MRRAWYSDSVVSFVTRQPVEIRDALAGEAAASGLPPLPSQIEAWEVEIAALQGTLQEYQGFIFLEFSIPRMGRRADVVLVIGKVILVLEFKVGKAEFTRADEDQVWDYALDLKNFHESSHEEYVVPVLVATEAERASKIDLPRFHEDKTCSPVRTGLADLPRILEQAIAVGGAGAIDGVAWEAGRYRPTPTIIEAARALYSRHSVEDISRNDAGATNLHLTSETLAEIIRSSQANSRKSICFVRASLAPERRWWG